MNCLNEISPDGLTGAILAIEGIADAAVLLNGPTGCKFYHGAIAEGQFHRTDSMDPLLYSEEFYFGQARVPATYLDCQDYIFGPSEKLEKILPVVAAKGHAMIAIVNSPGAALIGDDLQRFVANAGLSVPCVVIENTGFSGTFAEGFQIAVKAAVQRLGAPSPAVIKNSVNMIGMSIYHRYWEGSLQELHKLLQLCGIRLMAKLCAGTTTAEIETIGAAEYNLVIHGEFADRLIPWLEARFGTKSIIPSKGAPIGFEATEGWIREVCHAVEADPGPALAYIKETRKKSYKVLSRFNSLTGLPKAATFALVADSSVAYPLTRWLYGYLGMVPVSIMVLEKNEIYTRALYNFLCEIKCLDAWERPAAEVFPDVVLGSRMLITRLRLQGLSLAGVDISLPAGSHIDFLPKKLLGPEGALFILEKIINGLHRFYR